MSRASAAWAVAVTIGSACGPGGDGPGFGTGAQTATEAELASYPKHLDPRVATPGAAGAPDALPSSFVISDSELPPVVNQGELESCGAFALDYGLTTYTLGHAGGLDVSKPSNQVSPGYMYKAVLGRENVTCAKDSLGTTAKDHFEILLHRGSADVDTVKYQADCKYFDDELTLDRSQARADLKLGHWAAMKDPKDLDQVKRLLVAGRAIGILVVGYKDYARFSGPGVMELTQKADWWHFMLLVGFDDAKQAVRIQNSWGTAWGDQGFFWLSYDSYRKSIKEAYVAYPVGAPPPSGVSLNVHGAGAPHGSVAAHQRAASAGAPVHLVFTHHFDDGVRLTRSTLTSPHGVKLHQQHGWSIRSGQTYWTRTDGKAWPAGPRSSPTSPSRAWSTASYGDRVASSSQRAGRGDPRGQRRR